jgi:hypothetical protein
MAAPLSGSTTRISALEQKITARLLQSMGMATNCLSVFAVVGAFVAAMLKNLYET